MRLTSALRSAASIWTLRALGALLLAAGLGLAYLAPLEGYCFYLFAEGGRFHQPGFGVGSFMFGNIAAQIVGYEALAAMLTPLGYGYLRVRSWARHLAEALARAWVVAGLPFVVAFLAVLLMSKDVATGAAAAAILLLAVAYPGLPWLVRRLPRLPAVEAAFARDTSPPIWIEAIPAPLVGLAVIYALVWLALHVLILFHGLYPWFGAWRIGLDGITCLGASALLLAVLCWGTLLQRRWAWWGGLVFFGAMGVSWVVTLASTTWPGLLATLQFAADEAAILGGMPLQGWHLAVGVGLPLLLLEIQIARAGDLFGPCGAHPRGTIG